MNNFLSKSLPLLLQGTLTTVQIALAAIAVGICGGILIGICNCNRIRIPYLSNLFTIFVWTLRGTPLFVQVLIVYYALPELIGISFSPFFAGVFALGMNSTAYVSEIVRGGINSIPIGQWEASYAIGLKPWATLRGIILPQMMRITFPSLTNELSSLIKETSILMAIGVTELTKVSKDIVARELDPMTIYLSAAVLYLALTTSMTFLAKRTQKKWAI